MMEGSAAAPPDDAVEALREQWPYNDAELSRLLHRLHAWKSGKAQREVVLVCGTASLHCGVETDIIRDDPNLGSAAERTMKQLVAGPVSDMPHEFICELEGSIDQSYHFMYRHRRVLERRVPARGWGVSSVGAWGVREQRPRKDEGGQEDDEEKEAPAPSQQHEADTDNDYRGDKGSGKDDAHSSTNIEYSGQKRLSIVPYE